MVIDMQTWIWDMATDCYNRYSKQKTHFAPTSFYSRNGNKTYRFRWTLTNYRKSTQLFILDARRIVYTRVIDVEDWGLTRDHIMQFFEAWQRVKIDHAHRVVPQKIDKQGVNPPKIRTYMDEFGRRRYEEVKPKESKSYKEKVFSS